LFLLLLLLPCLGVPAFALHGSPPTAGAAAQLLHQLLVPVRIATSFDPDYHFPFELTVETLDIITARDSTPPLPWSHHSYAGSLA
jgi:hypothetical protein